MKKPKAQRPIDVKDTPWSHIGKDALDAAAEASWEVMRSHGLVWNCVDDEEMPPYHAIASREQTAVQRVVLSVLGFAFASECEGVSYETAAAAYPNEVR